MYKSTVTNNGLLYAYMCLATSLYLFTTQLPWAVKLHKLFDLTSVLENTGEKLVS